MIKVAKVLYKYTYTEFLKVYVLILVACVRSWRSYERVLWAGGEFDFWRHVERVQKKRLGRGENLEGGGGGEEAIILLIVQTRSFFTFLNIFQKVFLFDP